MAIVPDRFWIRQPAVIVDMDGTLVNVSSIRHYVLPGPGVEKDFHSFHAESIHCPPHDVAIEFCEQAHAEGLAVVVFTARMYQWLDLCRTWLDREMTVPYHGPFMRPDGDRRVDRAVKTDLYRYFSRMYDFRRAIDDNPSIVKLWQDVGLPVTVVPSWDQDVADAYNRHALGGR